MTDEENPTVLVADDANGVVEIYERWLQEDFEVLTATDGETAIARGTRDVDAVLVDRNLPDTPGTTVVEEIRKLGTDPAVVFLSSVEPDYEAIGVEFRECLTKPVMRRELVEAVERAVAGEPVDRPDSGGPSLSDHGPTDDDASDDGSGTDDGEESDDVSTEEITDRLQSLRSDLQDTAAQLSDQDEDSSGTTESDPDGADADPDHATGSPAQAEEDGPTGTTAADATDDRASEDGDEETDRQTGTERPREAIPDPDAGESGESLHSRVEELASKATELAEGTGETMADLDREDDEDDERD